MSLTLESPAFVNGQMIPVKYTCDGANISPPLKWSGVPEGTQSFALIFDDPDAPAKTWVHWVLFNIPGDVRALKEQIPADKRLANKAIHGLNDFKKHGYGGPCPPDGSHGYHMKLYALDTMLNLSPRITKQQLQDAMKEHILANTTLKGKYERFS